MVMLYELAVHHIHVHPVGAAIEHIADLFVEPTEVSG